VLWDFLSGGAESEATLRENRAAIERLRFRQRVCVNVRNVETKTQLFGCELRQPVFLAPLGSISRYHPDGALVAARVAACRGSLCFVSANAWPGLSAVAASVPEAPLIFQMYGYDQREVMAGLVRQAEQSPIVALCLTVDGAVYGRRERDLRNGFRPLDKPSRPDLDAVSGAMDRASRSGFDWDDLKWFRDQTKLPLILKGVLDAEDAALAVEAGVDVLYISNHGGRQLDFSAGTIELLPEIVTAVGGRAQILIDSGFQRGTDVLKALALGASAVGIGKLQGWALAADGEAGLDRALELLEVEIRTSMALIGATRIADLGPHNLRPPRQG
jgi:isopentenyl diphosphate isomerase/L-lactate dehydrogenase-like FMN-dependent dehydrogenase